MTQFPFCHNLQAPRLLKQRSQLRNERSPIPEMRHLCSLPSYFPDNKLRAGKTKMRATLSKSAQEPTRMIEMEMTEQHHVDCLGPNAKRREGIQEHVPLLQNSKARAQLGLEESSHAGFNENLPLAVVDKKTATRKIDAPEFIRWAPILPKRARHVAKHGAAIEALAITRNRTQQEHAASLVRRVRHVRDTLACARRDPFAPFR